MRHKWRVRLKKWVIYRLCMPLGVGSYLQKVERNILALDRAFLKLLQEGEVALDETLMREQLMQLRDEGRELYRDYSEHSCGYGCLREFIYLAVRDLARSLEKLSLYSEKADSGLPSFVQTKKKIEGWINIARQAGRGVSVINPLIDAKQAYSELQQKNSFAIQNPDRLLHLENKLSEAADFRQILILKSRSVSHLWGYKGRTSLQAFQSGKLELFQPVTTLPIRWYDHLLLNWNRSLNGYYKWITSLHSTVASAFQNCRLAVGSNRLDDGELAKLIQQSRSFIHEMEMRISGEGSHRQIHLLENALIYIQVEVESLRAEQALRSKEEDVSGFSEIFH